MPSGQVCKVLVCSLLGGFNGIIICRQSQHNGVQQCSVRAGQGTVKGRAKQSEGRAGQSEGRAGQSEGRAGQSEGRIVTAGQSEGKLGKRRPDKGRQQECTTRAGIIPRRGFAGGNGFLT